MAFQKAGADTQQMRAHSLLRLEDHHPSAHSVELCGENGRSASPIPRAIAAAARGPSGLRKRPGPGPIPAPRGLCGVLNVGHCKDGDIPLSDGGEGAMVVNVVF